MAVPIWQWSWTTTPWSSTSGPSLIPDSQATTTQILKRLQCSRCYRLQVWTIRFTTRLKKTFWNRSRNRHRWNSWYNSESSNNPKTRRLSSRGVKHSSMRHWSDHTARLGTRLWMNRSWYIKIGWIRLWLCIIRMPTIWMLALWRGT